MPWRLPEHDHRKFERNTIVLTVAQLRFHPILKIHDRLPSFQDDIRRLFPGYREQKVQDVLVESNGVRVGEQDQFQFLKDDSSSTVSLGAGALSLESTKHDHHEGFIEDFRVGLDALQKVFSPVSPIRLGFRYINVIDRERVSRDLERDVGWEELIQPEFLKVPNDLASLGDTRFSGEISSSMDKGSMTVRYGLLPTPGAEQPHFRLDVDRYCQEPFETGATLRLLEDFASDIYSIFRSVAADGLLEWMRAQED